jgi:hypothetical protein
VEKRLRQKLQLALAGVLAPGEQLLVASSGLHPKLAVGAGTLASIAVGSVAGLTIEAATGWGPTSWGPFLGAMTGMMVRWIFVLRSRSELQPAGGLPLIGLTDERLVLIETDFRGRATGATHEFPVAGVSEITLKKRLSGLSDTILRTDDSRTIHYQIRYAERIKVEIDRLQALG